MEWMTLLLGIIIGIFIGAVGTILILILRARKLVEKMLKEMTEVTS